MGDKFIEFLDSSGDQRYGLCMFAPAIMAPAANRLLNEAYGDAGDNLSVLMGQSIDTNIVQYRAGCYSSADLVSTKRTIDVLEKIPGAVMLIAEAGIGASKSGAFGILQHGRIQSIEKSIYSFHSFHSFAEEHLGVWVIENPSDIIEEFTDFGITISAKIITQERPAQILLRTPWEAIFRQITDDPESIFRFTKDPRAFEEFIAETYRLDGYEVELTPRSNDGGVDVIARKDGFGAIKIFDQAKAYSEVRKVSANDVRAAYGVLSMAQDASKVVITTTSDFAPGVYREFDRFMPTRLELRHGQNLIDWLKYVEEKRR